MQPTEVKLKRYLEHRDLVDEGYTSSWKKTQCMIRQHGFPPGILVSSQTRLWSRESLDRYMAEREALNLKAEVGFRVRKAAKVTEST